MPMSVRHCGRSRTGGGRAGAPALAVAGLLGLAPAAAWAATADNEPITFWKRIEEKGLYERFWQATRFYEDDEADVVQAFSLVGRYHGQYWAVEATPDRADGWENRRIYLGAEARLLHQVTVQAQIKVSDDFDPFYDGLYQAFVVWSAGEAFEVGVGRMDFLFAGLERSLSSTKIVAFERGLLVNQLLPSEVVGVVAHGAAGKFTYRAGVFSGSVEEELTEFRGGFGTVTGAGVELPLFYQTGALHLDYLFNNGNPANNALEPYEHTVSLWHQGQAGAFALGVDLTWARGLEDRPGVFGVTVLPTVVLGRDLLRKGDALQAVLRCQFAVSDGDNGLELQPRYEQRVVPQGFGDAYHAVYAGLNYLIFGDRLKLMAGVEYASMRDAARDGGEFDGWTYLAGVRLYF